MHLRFTFHALGIALLAASQLIGCTTADASDDSAGTGGSSAAGSTGSAGAVSSGGSGGSTGSAGTAGVTGAAGSPMAGGTCASEARTINATIATFDGCAIGSDATACAVPAIAGTTLFGGVFSYNDDTGNPMFSIVAGHSGSALALASTEDATQYGGGFGIWTSGCFDASTYSGVTFWVRGSAPKDGNATMTLQMSDTTPSTPPAGTTNRGTCPGTADTCKPPKLTFPVTDTWTQIHAKWADFTGGDAAGTPVTATGKNIWQFQWDAGLKFVPADDAGLVYTPVPAPYELQIDDVAFE